MKLFVSLACLGAALATAGTAGAATIAWKGHTWQLTSGGMAGVCQGDPQNVTVDASGYLHLRIADNGGSWTGSELFTTDRLGFGTYQWQVDGPIDTLDKNVVVGLFPYGPAAGIGTDGTNEIDIEYSRWGQANGPNGDWTDYPASGTTIGELSYTFSLGGATLSTSRFTWSGTSITSALSSGLQAVGDATGLIKSWTYAPANPSVNIPQQALPLGMNLWCFDSPPSDGKPVEIVIRDFVFVPAGSGGGGGMAGGAGGGSAGAAGSHATGGSAGAAGSHATGGAAGAAGSHATGGAAGAAGSHATGGAAGAAGSHATGGAAGAAGSHATGGSPGTAGSDATGGAAGAAGVAGSGTPATGTDGCGCAIQGDRARQTPGAAIVLFLAAAIALRRRASRGRRPHAR